MQEKAATVLRPVGFQLPTSLLRSGYIGTITYRGPKGNFSLHIPIKERIHSIHNISVVDKPLKDNERHVSNSLFDRVTYLKKRPKKSNQLLSIMPSVIYQVIIIYFKLTILDYYWSQLLFVNDSPHT